MKTVLLLSVLTLPPFVAAQPPAKPSGPSPWEYRINDFHLLETNRLQFDTPDHVKSAIGKLNERGKDGWELASIVSDSSEWGMNGRGGIAYASLVYYKRPRDAANRKKWEYLAQEIETGPFTGIYPAEKGSTAIAKNSLEELAKEGWELAAVIGKYRYDSREADKTHFHVMKRAK